MSAFGGNSNISNSNVDSARYNQKNASGYGDPRRSGNTVNRKNNPKANGPFKNNGAGNGTNNNNSNKRSGNNDRRRNNVYIHNKKGGNRPDKQESSPPVSTDPLDIPTKVLPRLAPSKVQQYSSEEINSTGPLIHNPEQLGFQRGIKAVKARPIPKYLLHQPRLLITPSFSQDGWDKQNQEKMLSMEAQNSGNDFQGLYEEFQRMRETERKQMEILGLVDAENVSKDLTDAISFRGSCLDMCPIFERVRRALEKNVKALEKDPVTNKISRSRAIKAFSRPAAGQPPPLPSEVRPPHILKQTLDYLIDNIVPELPEAHSFIWDRTRSIRQDFTYQNFFGPEAIDCNERIVRIHLVTLHIMAGSDAEFSQQQELEQFNKAMQTLIEIYQDVRNHGGQAPNEAEFRSYYLLSHLRDPELEREIQELPDDILEDKQVQLALMFRNIVSQNNIVERGYHNSIGALNLFSEFFKIVYDKETPFLMSCLLETQFNEIRFYALKSMSRCYHTRGKAYSAESLRHFLGFDSLEKLIKFVQYYEIDILYDNGVALVDLFNKEKLETKYKLNSVHDKPKLSPAYSTQIDMNIRGKSLKSFINCGRPNNTLGIKQPEQMNIVPVSTSSESLLPNNSFNQFKSTGFAPSGNASIIPSTSSKSKSLSDFLTNPTPSSRSDNQSFLSQATPANNQSQGFPSSIITPQVPFNNTNTQIPSKEIKPSFVFNNAPKAEIPKQATSSTTFNFGATSAPTTMPSVEKLPPAPIAFNSTQPHILPSFSLGSNNSQPIESKPIVKPPIIEKPSVSSKPAPTITPKPEKKKLIDMAQFPKALNEIYHDILQSTINTELQRLLPKLIKVENLNQERTKVIGSLSNELYQAFMSEIIYKTTLEVRADSFYKDNLILKMIRKVSGLGSKLKNKHELKRKKTDELHAITFNHPSIKRKSSSTSLKSLSPIKKRHIGKDEFGVEYIKEKQKEIRQLWEPINLKEFIENCSANLKMNIEMKDIELKFLLIVENWSSPYSKWLNTKLSLKINKEKYIYENAIKNSKLVINFTSLPNNDYLNKEFFTSTSFVLFECGFVSQDQVSKFSSIQAKLKRDQLVINKIISLANKYSYYKVQILIIFWDVTQSGITTSEVSTTLNLNTHIKNHDIEDLILCDMSATNTSINDVIVDAFSRISRNFEGELTKRGLRKREKVASIRRLNKLESADKKTDISNETFKTTENQTLNKAKLNKRYQYLSNHLSNTSASNISTNSNTSFMTANNVTIPNLAFPSNSTFLNLNNTFGNTTMNQTANESILTGFGNGVLEESTPFSSPKSNKFAKPKVQNIPRKLQQLRDLTAGIKARYKKT